jgi:tetratricopeptide (TPR) repeat protein
MTGKSGLWQVLALYAGASWLVLQVVDVVKDNLGLPDWVFPFALLLLLIGLPIIVATAVVQGRHAATLAAYRDGPVEDRPSEPSMPGPEARHRLFSWKYALAGGGLALLLLVVVTGGFMFMRNQGIGPVGSLVAKGMLDERSPVILTAFVADDPSLSRAATQAFRVDLSQTSIVRVLEPAAYADALKRMQRDPANPLTVPVARELAVREGVPAVIGGEIVEAGGSYVLAASVVAAESGELLVTHRETAQGDTEIIPSIDRLSRKIRELIGESFTSLRADPPLAAVTTSSLGALKLYSEALEEIDRRGVSDAGIPLLEEAVEMDPGFASAWRKLGVQRQNAGRETSAVHEALTRAYELRDRLTARERLLAEASYYSTVLDDRTRAAGAYDRMLDLDPSDSWALTNLAVIRRRNGELDRALELFQRATAVDSGPIQISNVMWTQIRLGQLEEALETAAIGLRLHPATAAFHGGRVIVAMHREDYETTRAELESASSALPDDEGVQIGTAWWTGNLNLLEGRIQSAIEHFAERAALVERRNPAAGRYDWAPAWIALQVTRDTASAAQHVARILSEQPMNQLDPLDRPYGELIGLYAAIGDEARARNTLAEYRSALPEAPDGRWEDDEARMEARLATAAGRYEESIDHWKRLREINPGCAGCELEGIARAHDGAGRSAEAIEWYHRELEEPFWTLPPDRALIFERLGELYDRTGDLENAAIYYARFVELWAEADPELQPRVQAARARLEEIVKERG